MNSRPDPNQLSLFPDRCQLTKVVPEENMRRFYAMRTLPTLFGDWALQREWGRIGSGGQLRHDLFRNEGAALNALAVLSQRKLLRGYHPIDVDMKNISSDFLETALFGKSVSDCP